MDLHTKILISQSQFSIRESIVEKNLQESYKMNMCKLPKT